MLPDGLHCPGYALPALSNSDLVMQRFVLSELQLHSADSCPHHRALPTNPGADAEHDGVTPPPPPVDGPAPVPPPNPPPPPPVLPA